MDNNKIGTYNFIAEPFHVDFTGRLTMGVLGNHLLNCAGFHAAERGFGIAEINENHYTWVLSRLAIELEDMPRQYEPFCIHSWIENVYRLFTDRNFELVNKDGKTIGEIDLSSAVGVCYVAEVLQPLDRSEAQRILENAEKYTDAKRRILIKGQMEVTKEAAIVFRDGGVRLIGVETQSVGPLLSPMEVHKILLSEDILLLEGIRLDKVKEGYYTLFAAPINLGDAEGAPCRAILVEYK